MSRSIYTVSSLVHYLKETVEHDMNMQSILIKGEISNFTNHRSGHWYFSLKDKKAKLNCVMFASYASKTKILLKEGMKVIVSASMSVYEPQGNVQLYVTRVQVDGLGDLYLQLEELKKKLAMEGLFDPAHKKALPLYPQKIVLISAKEGAAIQDMQHTLARRWPLADVTFLPSLVQGSDAAQHLIENLKKADELHPDVILLARGGGAIEDLWCFNDEQLARTIYACSSVVVTGVGHETDTTLVDYVSDARAATPTAAAELVTPDITDVKHLLHVQRKRMLQSMDAKLQAAQHRLQRLHANRYIKDPMMYIRDTQMRLAMMTKELEQVHSRISDQAHQIERIKQQLQLSYQRIQHDAKEQLQLNQTALLHGMEQYKEAKKQRLGTQMHLLDAFGPLKILSRGYGVLYESNHIVKSIHEVDLQGDIRIRMQDGMIHACVKEKEEF